MRVYISLSLSQNIRCRRSKLHSKHNAQLIMLENKQLHWRTGVQHFFTLQMGKSSRPLSPRPPPMFIVALSPIL